MAIQSTTNRISSSARSSAKTLVAKASKLPQLLFLTAVAWFLFIGTAHGDVFVSDYGSQKIQRFDDNGNLLNGNFIPGIGQGEGVACVKAVGSSDIYVANNSSVIGVYDLTTGVKDPAKTIQLSPNVTRIAGISFNKDGSLLYAADWGLGRLLAIDPTTRTVKYSVTFSPPGPSHDVVVGPDGNVYATQFNNHTGVVMFSPDFTTRSQFVLPGDHGLQYPGGLVFDHAGNLWVTNFDPANSFVSEYSSLGAYMRTVQDPNGRPLGIDVGPDGNIYVANFNLNNVVKIDVAGGSYGVTTFIANAGTEPKYVKFTSSCCDAAQPGYVEICKVSCADHPVTGTFTFTATNGPFNSGPLTIPVGACTPAFQTPSGTVTINEGVQLGVELTNVTAYGYDQHGFKENRLLDSNLPHRTADVKVVEGDESTETVATFTNCQSGPGELKICKVAGSGIKVGTLFTFMASTFGPPQLYTVPAGPAPGGYCVVAGMYQVGTPVLVQEVVPPGVKVADIEVNPPDRGGTKTSNSVIAIIDSGTTEVTFTDEGGVPPGSCQASSSLSVLLVNNNNVIAYVPKGYWGGGNTGVAVANIEGTSITNITLPTTDVVNSCASDPTLKPPLTVCTANSNVAYVFDNTPSKLYTLTSAGSGTIGFSGGSCTNCGVAMDGVHHKAVVGLSLPVDKPGFQFLDLFDSPTPPSFEPNGFISPAGEISEDPLIDPISAPPLLLSAAENGDYEIADIHDTLAPVFYENQIKPPAGPDSSGEDCSTGIALAPTEAQQTVMYVGDLHQSTFANGKWTAVSQFQTLTEANLHNGGLAVAQGTHIGVVGQEFGGSSLTAISLPSTSGPGTGVPAIQDWLTCSIVGFSNGYDPHTVTAYQTPGAGTFPTGDAIAVLANSNASMLAVVDLTRMLDTTFVTRTSGAGLGHACASGFLATSGPKQVVTFVPLTP